MIRVEIIANHSVEENILEALARENAGKFYTKYSNVFGAGRSGPRMGDAVWPEENFTLVIWCEMDEAEAIERAIKAVKQMYPNEGIKLFGLPDPAALQLPPPAAFPGAVAPAGSGATPVSGAAIAAASAADSGVSGGGDIPAAPPPAPQSLPPNFGGESF
jgi:hypothetical protein